MGRDTGHWTGRLTAIQGQLLQWALRMAIMLCESAREAIIRAWHIVGHLAGHGTCRHLSATCWHHYLAILISLGRNGLSFQMHTPILANPDSDYQTMQGAWDLLLSKLPGEMIMPWSMRPGGASDRMLQTAQEIGREECTVYTGMTGGAGKWNLDHVLPGGSIDVSSVHSFDQLHLALQLKLQEISKCLMLWVLRLRGKETQWYQRAWFFNQATNMPWHNKEQKRCSLRNSLDVSRTPKEKWDEDGDESHGGDSEVKFV